MTIITILDIGCPKHILTATASDLRALDCFHYFLFLVKTNVHKLKPLPHKLEPMKDPN